ncbi:MAG: hypothetical protein OEY06_06135 [Gammaproteobacteria bacterium]|nr:hypothetical protein [Gammaproteobacteria bacterium]
MMKSNSTQHVIVYLLLAAGVFITLSYKTELDKLMEVQAGYMKENTGIREMRVESDRVNPEDYVVFGSYSILYFYSNSCPACRRLNTDLQEFINIRPDVAVLKFDLGYDWSDDDAYNTYRLKIGKTPFIHIYDPSGNVVAKDIGYEEDGLHLLKKWVEAELYKVWDEH